MSILSNQTARDLEKNPKQNTKAEPTGTVFDSCYFSGKYDKSMDCDKCPHKTRCSWYDELSLRR